jgi:radical SAM/Cys-rich protein
MKPMYEWVDDFLSEQGVDIIASMPCYSPTNVNAQRGDGVFDDSIAALQRLNARGYGRSGSGLNLDLVYNPGGASLPPDQQTLEEAYKRELKKAFGIEFHSLFCITNMPIKRFADDLRKSEKLDEYMELLVSSFNIENTKTVMCRDSVHVGYDGTISDCDFNYALNTPARVGQGTVSIRDVTSFADLAGHRIQLGKHCWGCVAGSGSS